MPARSSLAAPVLTQAFFRFLLRVPGHNPVATSMMVGNTQSSNKIQYWCEWGPKGRYARVPTPLFPHQVPGTDVG